MSFTAVEIATPHNFSRAMVDTMTRPPIGGWSHGDPYAPRHNGYYAETISRGTRLPPPSSLVSGAPVGSSPPRGREPHPIKTNYHHAPQHDYQTPSPIQQSSPPPPPPTSEPHYVVHMTQQLGRRHGVDLSRVSPTLSSPASERSEEALQDARLRHLARESSTPQLPRIYNPARHRQGPSAPDDKYDSQQSNLPSPYATPRMAHQAHNQVPPHQQQKPPPSSPPNRQTWSPRSEPKTERVKISDLLSEEPRNTTAQGATSGPMALAPQHAVAEMSEYRIRVRQQPVAARSCGFGERDRRVIDPPPIVQLTIENSSLGSEEVSRKIRHPFSVVHCSIWDESGEQDNSAMPEDYRQQRRLMGTLVASPFVGLDENGEEGCFFCFPDLSCRTPGSFRLKFVLVVLDPMKMQPGSKTPVRAQAMSDVFTVYNAKDFPGMQASTALTRRLKEQGCLISIKKGNDKASHSRDDSDDDDGEEASSGPKRKRAKKN